MTWLCDTCRTRFVPYSLSCIICRTPHPRGLTCAACQASTALTGVVSVGAYSSVPLQRGVEWLKFKGITSLAIPLAELLTPRLSVITPLSLLQEHAVLIPLPLHPQRLRERGFNQSSEIARHLSARTGITIHDSLQRTKKTWTQSHLPPELRHDNVAGAFSYIDSPDTKYRIALIVDDVTTSGSTLTAAAHALKNTGFSTMWGVTVARG